MVDGFKIPPLLEVLLHHYAKLKHCISINIYIYKDKYVVDCGKVSVSLQAFREIGGMCGNNKVFHIGRLNCIEIVGPQVEKEECLCLQVAASSEAE